MTPIHNDLLYLATRTPVTEDEAGQTLAAVIILDAMAEAMLDEAAGCDWCLYILGAIGDPLPRYVGVGKDPYAQLQEHLTDAKAGDRLPVPTWIDSCMPAGVWLDVLQSGMTQEQADDAKRALVRTLTDAGRSVLNREWD